jgi:poly(3-hydroxybutyrate) depolymerase
MKRLMAGVLTTVAVAIAQVALVTKTFSEDIAPHIETIPIQTLTISDEQFLKVDASGRPTIISGILKVARGSGPLPLVILLHGSGGSRRMPSYGSGYLGRWVYPLLTLIRLLDAGSLAPLLISRSSDA